MFEKTHDILHSLHTLIIHVELKSQSSTSFALHDIALDSSIYFFIQSTSHLKLLAAERNRTILRIYYYRIIGRCETR